MAAESSKRSKLIDVTYHQLHLLLSGYENSSTQESIEDMLKPRLDIIKKVRKPFGVPNAESKRKVEGGAVTLRDGHVVHVDDALKPFVFAISSRFSIDEVEATVLLRSYLYNEGIPPDVHSGSDDLLVQEVLDAFTPFYHTERRCLLRLIVPLLRATEHELAFFYEPATRLLPQVIPDGPTFVREVMAEYTDKARAPLPDHVSGDPRLASKWAKDNMRDQLVLLEVAFWGLWDYIPRTGPLVQLVYQTGYGTNIGSSQQVGTLLLDGEGDRLIQDSATVWLLLMTEVLELENFSDNGNPDISSPPMEDAHYTSSPSSLKQIHQLVISHGDARYSLVYLAWTIILARLEASARALESIPPAYKEFFDSLDPRGPHPYTKSEEPIHSQLLQRCLDPCVGLLNFLHALLTTTPIFVTSIAWQTESSITDPNSLAYRSVIKGLLIALSELIPVELIPDFDTFLEVWVALFGQSESQSVIGLCQQFWQYDYVKSAGRRAVLDVARARFPVQFKPLLRLLGALTGSGFKKADPLGNVDYRPPDRALLAERALSAQHVSYYLDMLPTFTQVLPASACTGAHALYEKVPERYGSSSKSTGLTYINLRPIRLPGGSILPPRSTGRLLSQDGEDYIIVAWEHDHSGWALVMEVLVDYARRRRLLSTAPSAASSALAAGRRGATAPIATLSLQDIGLDVGTEGDPHIVAEALDLLCSVIKDNAAIAEQVLQEFGFGEDVDENAPELVQLTMLILEDALSRSAAPSRKPPLSHLITSSMNLLAGLLSLPKTSQRVWLFARASTTLFETNRNTGSAAAMLAAERALGSYSTTHALLLLVHSMFDEASKTTLIPGKMRMLGMKEEVLLRALRFVHAEIWMEHAGWKYAHLGTRFEVGRMISGLYADILDQAPPTSPGPLAAVGQAVYDAFVLKATTSSIGPLLTCITTYRAVLHRIYTYRRLSDLRGLSLVMRSHLRLIRLSLTYKQRLHPDAGACLLEQALCSKAGTDGGPFTGGRHQVDPLDVLTGIVSEGSMETLIPIEAVRVLYALCTSLATSQPSAPSIVGHLSDPEAAVSSLVRLAQHPYQDLDVRLAIWRFMTVAVENEPALGHLFVAGHFRTPEPDKDASTDKDKQPVSGLSMARKLVAMWQDFWEVDPAVLASVLGFVAAVWTRGLEHQNAIKALREDAEFWGMLAAIVQEDLSPAPEYRSTEITEFATSAPRSVYHDSIRDHAYRVLSKALAVRIFALDLGMEPPSATGKSKSLKSYEAIAAMLKSEEQLTDHIQDAISNAYDPSLYDDFVEQANDYFPNLTLQQLESSLLVGERQFGDDFAFSATLLSLRMAPFQDLASETQEIIHALFSINLNLSLAHASTELGKSWHTLLVKAAPFIQGQPSTRPMALSLAATIVGSIAEEKRAGELMSICHGVRMSILLALLELAWFWRTETKKDDLDNFMKVVTGTRGLVINEAQPPLESVRGLLATPFHRSLLQVIYFCVKQSRNLIAGTKTISADYRLTLSSTVDASLTLVIDSLRFVFEAAQRGLDPEADADMELLVAAFEQCTRSDVTPSSAAWLTRCQETNVIKASLELFARSDLSGLSSIQLSRSRKQALYAPHLLTFHIALASIPASAERLASEGVLIAYSNSSISPAVQLGSLDVAIPDMPGERSPAHRAYCIMLSVVSGVITALGLQKHFFDAEASGLVQLFGNQVSRALSWTVGDLISLPLVEEMERVVSLFYAIASTAPPESHRNQATERVLSAFASSALLLLQQLNYAVSHPNHLASLVEPVTAEERSQLDKDSRAPQNQSSAAEIVDPLTRPFLARLVHRLFALSSNIVCTLIVISGADAVLNGETEDLPTRFALVIPHSKVVLGEPASMGTLLELASSTLDVLNHLVTRPGGQALTPASERPLDVREAVITLRRNLEAVLFYGVTQLGIWVAKPELLDGTGPGTSGDAEMDEAPEVSVPPRDRRGMRRESVALTERMRRGMTGEMGGELKSMIERARGTLEKSGKVAGGKQGNVDVTKVLLNFLTETVINAL
ncbi:hypothetical protein FA95DRAFT_1133922 [Auriscalpium vulgare]|uniref:Uncharacterized protein n=1 Tax=Auriscalpium vulgare TaxID=40419 RepID=A0ACB8RV75_9AGAM|nr:hypothetical protein FA95DRAFT_1133922 [Auriscalpium vulgare]